MKIIISISAYFVLLPLGIIVFRKHNVNREQKLLRWVIYLSSITQLISRVLWYLEINNLPLFHIYPIVELVLLSIIYQGSLKSFFPPVLIPLLSGSTILFSIINSLFIQSIFSFSSNAITLECGVVIIYSVSYFIKLLRFPPIDHLDRNPMFWINCAVLIYFSGSFMIFMYSNHILPGSKDMQMVVWSVHGILNIVMYTLYSIALWVKEKN